MQNVTDYPLKTLSAVYTFSHGAEADPGGEVINSESAKSGKSRATGYDDLIEVQQKLGGDIVQLHREGTDDPKAWVYVCPDGVDKLMAWSTSENPATAQSLINELNALGHDGVDKTRRARNGDIQHKHARWGFVLSDFSQTPDIANRKHRVHNFSDVSEVAKIRAALGKLSPDFENMVAEANVYFNEDCGIGYHGDDERPKSAVIGVNMGAERKVMWRPFKNFLPCGPPVEIHLRAGTIYMMSENAVGIGWTVGRTKTMFRHRAGSDYYLQKQDRMYTKRWDKRHATYVAKTAIKNEKTNELEMIRAERLRAKAERAEKKRTDEAAAAAIRREQQEAKAKLRAEKDAAKKKAQVERKAKMEAERTERNAKRKRDQEAAAVTRTRERLENKRKKTFTADLFAEQTAVLVDAAREGTSDYLFYKWLECSPNTEHKQLHVVWQHPQMIAEEGSHGEYGMNALERTRKEFDAYVEFVKAKRQAQEDEMIAGASHGISPI
jgi:hypothetical protein